MPVYSRARVGREVIGKATAVVLFALASHGPLQAAAALYGDGSAGDLVINTPTDWNANPPNANFQFKSVTVSAPWIIPSGVTLKVMQNFKIEASGSVAVAPPPSQIQADNGVTLGYDPGQVMNIGLPKIMALGLLHPGPIGGTSGGQGCGGGSGGGTLLLEIGGELIVDGTLSALGQDGQSCSGGGGGGVLIIVTGQCVGGNGTIDVSGGKGGNTDPNGGTSAGSGGGGGILRIVSAYAPHVFAIRHTPGKHGTGDPNAHNSEIGGASGGNGGGVYLGYNFSGYIVIEPSDGKNGYVIVTIAPHPENLLQ